MSQTSLLRGATNAPRLDDYIRAIVIKDYAALSAILSNTGGLLRDSLVQLQKLSVQAQAAAATAVNSDNSARQSATSAKTSETNSGSSEANTTDMMKQCVQIKSDVTDIKSLMDAGLRTFSRTWLGEHDTDPTETAFGDALVTGAQYYNTVTKKTRIYTAAGEWEDISADAQSMTLSIQQILQQCQSIETQCQNLANQIAAQLNTSIRNNYGIITNQYGLYAGLFDTADTSGPGSPGVAKWCYRGADGKDVWYNTAGMNNLLTEVANRTAADTALDNNKVNRSGDNVPWFGINGTLYLNSSDSKNQARLYTDNGDVNGGNDLVMGLGDQVIIFQKNGVIKSPSGTVAYQSDVSTESANRAAADTSLDNNKVNRGGDTITGDLSVNGNLTGKSNFTFGGGGYTGSLNYGPNSTRLALQNDGNAVWYDKDGSFFSISRSAVMYLGQNLAIRAQVAADIATEAAARAAADTSLDNNKVNRGGDTITGDLTVKGAFTGSGTHTVNGDSFVYGRLVAGQHGGTSAQNTLLYFGKTSNLALQNDDTLVQYDQTGPVLASSRASGLLYLGSKVALVSDVSTEAAARAAADTALDNNKVNRSGDNVPWFGIKGTLYLNSSDGVNQARLYTDNGTTNGGNDLVFGLGDQVIIFQKDGTIKSPSGTVAYMSNISTEAAARAAADTTLDNNKVNRGGDTITGNLSVNGTQTIGGSLTSYGLLTAGVHNTTSGSVSNIYYGGTSRLSFQNDDNLVVYDSTGAVFGCSRSGGLLYLGNRVALAKDVSAEAASRAAADTTLDNNKVNRSGDNMTWLGLSGTLYLNSSDGKNQARLYTDTGDTNGGNDLVVALADQVIIFQKDGTIKSPKGVVAYQSDVNSEAAARSAADTTLDNNKVNRGGDTITGSLSVNGAFTAQGVIWLGHKGTDANANTNILFGTQSSMAFQGDDNMVLRDNTGVVFACNRSGGLLYLGKKVATSADIASEAASRASQDTWLDGFKVNRSGDTMSWLTVTGGLTSKGNVTLGADGAYTTIAFGPNTTRVQYQSDGNTVWYDNTGVIFNIGTSGLSYSRGDISTSGNLISRGNSVQARNYATSLMINTYVDSNGMATWDLTDFTSNSNKTWMRMGQDGNLATGMGTVAFKSDVASEASSRAAGDTHLDNVKVNRAGDTITGSLEVDGNMTNAGDPVMTSTWGNRKTRVLSVSIPSNGDGGFKVDYPPGISGLSACIGLDTGPLCLNISASGDGAGRVNVYVRDPTAGGNHPQSGNIMLMFFGS